MKKYLLSLMTLATLSSAYAECDITIRIQGLTDDAVPMFELNSKDIQSISKKLTQKGYTIVEMKSLFDRSEDNSDYTVYFTTNGLGGFLSNSNVYMSNHNDETIVNESKSVFVREGLVYRRLANKIPACKNML